MKTERENDNVYDANRTITEQNAQLTELRETIRGLESKLELVRGIICFELESLKSLEKGKTP